MNRSGRRGEGDEEEEEEEEEHMALITEWVENVWI